jgi:hypothetical protein
LESFPLLILFLREEEEEKEDKAEQSEEDSEGGRDILEGQSEKDSVEDENLSNDLLSKAEEKLMRPYHDKPMAPLLLSHDDYWWPSPTSIENKRASDGQMKDKLPYSAKRLKSDPKVSCFPNLYYNSTSTTTSL